MEKIFISYASSLPFSANKPLYLVDSHSLLYKQLESKAKPVFEEQGHAILSPAARWQGCCCADWADFRGTLHQAAFARMGIQSVAILSSKWLRKTERRQAKQIFWRWFRYLDWVRQFALQKSDISLERYFLRYVPQRLYKMTHEDMEENNWNYLYFLPIKRKTSFCVF